MMSAIIFQATSRVLLRTFFSLDTAHLHKISHSTPIINDEHLDEFSSASCDVLNRNHAFLY